MPETMPNGIFKQAVEARLKALLTEPAGASETDGSLYKAMSYSALDGGKRIRAFLVFGFYLACKADGDLSIAADYAAAIEMMHAASLIHDDLPSMDNDDYRRGKLSNHKVFGEAGAILAGDGLIIKAFETAASCSHCSPEQNLKAVRVLASKSGPDGMTGGQMLDIAGDTGKINGEMLEKLHTLKTACLISSACMLGCIAADAAEKKIKAAEEYGRCVGLAFQIRDDILDINGDPEKMGKTLGKDKKESKATYPALFGMESSYKICKALTERAAETLGVIGDNAAEPIAALKRLALYLSERNS